MGEERMELPHKLTLNQRQQLVMSGVTEIISFDDTAVILKTSLGTLAIQGSALQLKELSVEGGQVAVDGKISALIYEEPRGSGGWVRRLFG